jgi:hypothetical protein
VLGIWPGPLVQSLERAAEGVLRAAAAEGSTPDQPGPHAAVQDRFRHEISESRPHAP